MTKEEALNTLMKMRAWRAWGKEQKEEERPEMPQQKEVDEAFDVCIELLQQFSLPSNLDEAAEESMPEEKGFLEIDIYGGSEAVYSREQMLAMFKAGAEWMAGQYKPIKAHCVESSNPVSESPNQRLHLITLLYEEDKDTTHVIGGDDIEICIRKK